MAKRTRRNHSANFKAKLAISALAGEKIFAELAEHYLHAYQITTWTRQLTEE